MAQTELVAKKRYLHVAVVFLMCGFVLIMPGTAQARSAKSLQSMARMYIAVGEYAKAQPLAEEALSVARSGGNSDAQLSLCMIDLSWLYRDLGRLADAEKMCLSGLGLQQKAYGQDHPYVAYTLRILGSIYQENGKYDQAAGVFGRAMAIMQANHESADHQLAGFWADIAGLQTAQGKFAEAEASYARAMDLINKSYGPNHLYTAGVFGQMANLYVLQERFDEAQTLIEQALKTQQEVYGPDHHALAPTWLTMGRIHIARADYSRAESVLTKTLTVVRDKFGSGHPLTGKSLAALGGLYLAQGKYSEALEVCSGALATLESLFDDNHPKVADILETMSQIHRKSGEIAKADELLRRARQIRQTSRPAYEPVARLVD
ncbi:MAG: tetratricopeptide repeat protein [Planctomycetota bacterium]